MLRMVLFALALAAAPLSAKADAEKIRDVIASQIDAFEREDLDAAWEYASPFIQRMFRTPTRFGGMVESGYPMVWEPSSVRFGLLEEREGQVYQYVALDDMDGRSHLAEYEMIELEDAGWKINGVRILPSVGTGA